MDEARCLALFVSCLGYHFLSHMGSKKRSRIRFLLGKYFSVYFNLMLSAINVLSFVFRRNPFSLFGAGFSLAVALCTLDLIRYQDIVRMRESMSLEIVHGLEGHIQHLEQIINDVADGRARVTRKVESKITN